MAYYDYTHKKHTQNIIAQDLSRLTSHEYRDDILQEMERLEGTTLPDVASIDIQTEIQWFMRPYLLDFLIEAHAAFGLLQETLFLTINLLDRYCSKRIVYKKHYQLVGCSALLIAAKYGDRKDCVPTIKELNTMCCGLYDDDMFTQMEWHVLQTLDWAIGHPTIDHFVQMALEYEDDAELENMACYISEIALFQKEFVSKTSSDMARSSLALARCILNRVQPSSTDWSAGYDSQTLITLSQQLHRPSAILSRKYSTNHHSRVSIILDDFLARQASIVKSYNAPPTPPSDKPLHPATPKKPTFTNGCLTPPITPTNQEYFKPAQQPQYHPAPHHPPPHHPTPYHPPPQHHPPPHYHFQTNVSQGNASQGDHTNQIKHASFTHATDNQTITYPSDKQVNHSITHAYVAYPSDKPVNHSTNPAYASDRHVISYPSGKHAITYSSDKHGIAYPSDKHAITYSSDISHTYQPMINLDPV